MGDSHAITATSGGSTLFTARTKNSWITRRPAGRNFLTSKPCGKKFTAMTIKKMIDISRTDLGLCIVQRSRLSRWNSCLIVHDLIQYSNMDVDFLVNLYQILTT